VSRFVLDASVALRWVLDPQPPPYASRVRDGLHAGSLAPVVPWLWHWEVANSVAYHERQGLISASETVAAWASVRAWSALVATDAQPQVPLAAAFELARHYGLTVYDASYLELAMRLRVPLATLDHQLLRAAAHAQVAMDFS